MGRAKIGATLSVADFRCCGGVSANTKIYECLLNLNKMKTPKEYANELVEKYRPHAKNWNCYFDEPLKENHAKQCALISVDEVIKQWEYIDTYLANGMGKLNPNLEYWQQVKTEIQNS